MVIWGHFFLYRQFYVLLEVKLKIKIHVYSCKMQIKIIIGNSLNRFTWNLTNTLILKLKIDVA